MPEGIFYLRWQANLIGSAHGDMIAPRKTKDLALIMAEDCAPDWGVTRHRVWYMGHVHHHTVKEEVGCTVETFPVLAPGDPWHNRSGYRSGRKMHKILRHAQHGEVSRTILDERMLG